MLYLGQNSQAVNHLKWEEQHFKSIPCFLSMVKIFIKFQKAIFTWKINHLFLFSNQKINILLNQNNDLRSDKEPHN